ncbi:MAG: LysM peptidoglycan-binding domain-containing protein [Chloroflexota bacterium]|nr:LysM peptidoglycan-binding domain-containing protein [Chloroflexota bacterium]
MSAVRRYWKLLIPLLCVCFSLPTLYAQTNPTVAACGMPLQGGIQINATYSLSGDCVMTDELSIGYLPEHPITVTINGNGHTISLPNAVNGIHLIYNSILNLNQVTIEGGAEDLLVGVEGGVLNANQVTFTNGSSLMLNVISGSLNNTLLERHSSDVFSLYANGSVALVKAGHSLALHNVVMRGNIGDTAAIVVQNGGSLTATGCLSFSGNAPYDVYVHDGGTWTDSSTGPCTGAIGNGATVAPAPAPTACGLPAAGNLDVSATYTLTADCALTGRITLSEDVDIAIVGNGHTIRSSLAGYVIVTAVTSSLRLENVALEGFHILNWGDLRGEKLIMSDIVGGITNMGEARFSNALFEGNGTPSATSRSILLAYNAYANGYASFTDASFIGNTGGLGALATYGSVIDLNGCIHFEDNSPADTYIYSGSGGAVNDNRDPDCDSPIVDPLIPPVVPPAPRESEVICNPHCPELQLQYCDIALGAIGLVCRPPMQPPEAYIYRVTSESEGFFSLGLSQPQVEAVEAGLVACSADGRVAVRVGLKPEIRHFFEISPKYHAELLVPRRYIVISKGPNVEGKVNHVVLDNALDGRVFGIVSTHGGPPAAECITPAEQATRAEPAPVYAPFVQAQAPQPDGSIVHIARPGDTINAIAVAYEVDPLEIIIFNQLENMGRWIYPGQKLLIREADA